LIYTMVSLGAKLAVNRTKSSRVRDDYPLRTHLSTLLLVVRPR